MDLINNFFGRGGRDKSRPFSGWSASYTNENIVQQLYSFLFDTEMKIMMVK